MPESLPSSIHEMDGLTLARAIREKKVSCVEVMTATLDRIGRLNPKVNAVAPQDVEEERRLCYVGMTRAERRLILTSAMRRRLFGEYQATEPSRFVDEVPRELVDDVSADAVNASRIGFGRSGLSSAMNTRSRWARAQESEPTYSYADEDQSAVSGLRPGVRVRHAQFGVGTVLSVEQLEDDSKLIVRFVSVGQKTLRAKYAKLDLVG